MKIAALIARILLGLLFVFAGLNGFFQWFKGPMPTGPAGQFIGALFASHMVYAVSALQVIGGVPLLIGRYIPLGLVVLGPVIFNILLFHIFMEHTGLPLAIVVAILWFLVFARYRQNFAGIFAR